MNLLEQLRANLSPGPFHVSEADAIAAPTERRTRLIAYYLPQFHPIPENDEWWGKGFTEWTSATKALPRYEGQLQPRLPADLGFYDLRSVDVLRAQAEMAKRFGIEGFCIHYYWFGGRKLLETPLELLLANPDIDLPFCLNWPNENWTRTWDASETSVLMGQSHSPEDDLAFARSIEPALRDPRYIRVQGKPLLMLYRPAMLPDIKATVARWRAYFRDVGIGEIYLVVPQVRGAGDPREFGMDAAAGFPPHNSGFGAPSLSHRYRMLDPDARDNVVPYEQMAARSLANQPRDYILHPGVAPSWDNTARRKVKATYFAGSTPQKYGDWLWAACQRSDLVFINAWNEWAEGAYLEPDVHNGFAYLSETAQVLHDLLDPQRGARRERGAQALAAWDDPYSRKLMGRGRMVARKAIRAVKRVSTLLRSKPTEPAG